MLPQVRGGRGLSRIIFLLSVITLIGFFIVNTVGFLDTETGSALGCGRDWPLCKGAVIPDTWGLHTLVEFGHRAIVGVSTAFLLATAVLGWIRFGRWVEVRVLVMLSVGFVFVQAALGAIGVIYGDPAWFLSFHFGCSLMAFVSVLLLTIVIRQIEHRLERPGPEQALRKSLPIRKFSGWIWITLVYLYVEMYFGAFVASSGAGGTFRGLFVPTEVSMRMAFFMDIVHRGSALVLLLLTFSLFVMAYRMRKERQDLYVGSIVANILVVLQGAAGMFLVATHLSRPAFLIHVTVVTFLFAALCYMAMQSLPEPNRRAEIEAEILHPAGPSQ